MHDDGEKMVGCEKMNNFLKFGCRGHRVVRLQKRLAHVGYEIQADGVFGLVTDRVVRQFQRDHLLPENGIVAGQEMRILFEGFAPLFALADRGREVFSASPTKQRKLPGKMTNTSNLLHKAWSKLFGRLTQ